jgi:EmrB/QacA subfamily drug resistance transporter
MRMVDTPPGYLTSLDKSQVVVTQRSLTMRNLSQLARERIVLAIVCTGVALASLDLFVVNVALPDMGRQFGVGLDRLSWVISAYAITYASLLVVLGRVADRHARDRGFLVGVATFVAGSSLCAAAPTASFLIAARVVQAAGAALLTPTSLGLVLTTTAPERRGSAVRAWTAIGGLAAAIGPVVGGLLVTLSWRWVFVINVPVGAVALVLGWRLLPRLPGHAGPRPDVVGAVLVTGAVALVTWALVDGTSWGWTSTRTVGTFVAAIVAGVAFAWRSAVQCNPLIDRGTLRAAGFISASTVAAVFTAAFGAMLLSIVLWQQQVWHWSALRTGFAVAPGPLMVPLFSFFVVGGLLRKWGPAIVAAAGCATFAAGTLWWLVAITLDRSYAATLLPGILLTGIGVGLALPTLMTAATTSLPESSAATGSAVINMARQIGLAIGVALLVGVVGAPASPSGALGAFRRGWLVVTVLAVTAAVLSVTLLRAGARPRAVGASPATTPALAGGAR